jgi:hypothetical protein
MASQRPRVYTVTQNERILRFLKRGKTLTRFSAARLFGCANLRASVQELREAGVAIETESLILSTGTRVARYRLGAPT